MMRNLLRFALQRFLREAVVIVFIVLFVNDTVHAITKTSTGNTGWNLANTWSPQGVPLPADDVIIDHAVTISSGEYTVNSITINGKLTVNGTLTIIGNLSTDVDGEFVMGQNAVVIVKGNVSLGNKCIIDLSSYLIVLGNFTKSGSDGQGSITANNAHIYILGTTIAPNYFTICDQYSGTTTNTTLSSCDGGTFNALVTNETNNPNPIVLDIVQQVTSTINPSVGLLPASANLCSGGSVTLTINEPRTIELLKWYRGTTLVSTQNRPQSPYSYSVNVAATYYALYKVIVNNTDVWYKTYSSIVSTLGSSPSQPGAITGVTTQCPGLIIQIYNIGFVSNATTYTWTVPTGWSITEGAGTNSIAVTTGSSGQNGNITVTAGNSCGTSSAESLPVTVNPNLPVSVSIGASATTICAGTSVTFTATPTNGGTTPTYQWKLNGSNVGTGGASYTNSTLVDNDQVNCVMISNATPCLTGSPATSNTVTMTVNPLMDTPNFTGGDTSICQDEPDETYSATAANSTSISYSVLPVEAGIIDSGTGVMNWSPTFFGTATITATATGTCGTSSADRSVTVNPKPIVGTFE